MYLTTCHGEAMQGGQITYIFVYLPKNGALFLQPTDSRKSFCHLQCSTNEIDTAIRHIGLKHFS